MKDGKFDRDTFGDEIGGQVEHILSQLDDEDVEYFDADALPDLAFEMALDVGRKRRTYLQKKTIKKNVKRGKRGGKRCGPRRKRAKVARAKVAKKQVAKKQVTVDCTDDHDTDASIEAEVERDMRELFDSAEEATAEESPNADKDVVSYRCSSCKKSLGKKTECFPAGSHDKGNTLCKKCFTTSDNVCVRVR